MYQYAKLRMLQFYYDFLDKYLDRSDFQMCEMDTDSAYIAIAGESVESLVKPELKAEFEADKCNWFPRTDTPEHKSYDKRTPGLFKVEWEGQGIIGLCSKTFYCFGAQDKFSFKELTRNVTRLTKTSICKCCSQNRIVQVLTEVFVLLTTPCTLMSKLGMHFRIFIPNVKFSQMELAPLHSTFKFSSWKKLIL